MVATTNEEQAKARHCGSGNLAETPRVRDEGARNRSTALTSCSTRAGLTKKTESRGR